MKQLIIPFVVALVLGTGAATGVAVQRGKAAAIIAQAQADSVAKVKADSVKAAATPERVIEDPNDTTARHDTTAATHDTTAATHDTTKAPVVGAHAAPPATVPSPAVPAGHAAAPEVKQQAAATPKQVLKTNADSVGALSEKRIAKAFASMPPKDAAKVFEMMSDADVGFILAALSDKEAAAILAKLPPQRVATLSRASLRNHVTGVVK